MNQDAPVPRSALQEPADETVFSDEVATDAAAHVASVVSHDLDDVAGLDEASRHHHDLAGLVRAEAFTFLGHVDPVPGRVHSLEEDDADLLEGRQDLDAAVRHELDRDFLELGADPQIRCATRILRVDVAVGVLERVVSLHDSPQTITRLNAEAVLFQLETLACA